MLAVAAAVAIGLIGAAAPVRAEEGSGNALAVGQQVASMATTFTNRYAVMKDGTLWGWGSNDYGQLGNGSQKDSQTPMRIMGGVKQVSAYANAVLAVKTDGTVWAWGKNDYGQLGNGNENAQRVPVRVAGLSGIKSVLTESGHSFAIGSDGSLFAWGDNTFHALGTSAEGALLKPVKVASGVKQVDASGDDVRVVKSNGDLYAFGTYGTESSSSSNIQKKYLSNIKEVYVFNAGYESVTYAIANDGWLWAWGYNGNGLIGDGTTTNRDRPVRVLKDVKQVTGNTGYSNYAVAALKRDGTVWTWGDNEYGQLGIGNVASASWSPKKVVSLSSVASISETADTMYAVTSGGNLYAWGVGQFGSLGNGTDTDKQFTPVKVMGSVRSVYGTDDDYTAYAVIKDGSLWGWGSNSSDNARFGILDPYFGEEWPQHIMFGRPQTKTRGFADLSSDSYDGDWAVKEGWLGYAVDNGLMGGLNPADHGGKKLFDPYGKVTRAQVATVLYRLAGSPKYKAPAKDFSDNADKSSWYYDEVRWAASAGVVTGLRNADGSYTRFAPNNDIWRQDLAVMMQRYAQKVAKVKTDTSEAKASKISGWGKVSGYARDAVAWSVNAGLMGGVNTDKGKQLQPDVTTDRSALAKTASVLKRDVIG